MNKHVTVVIIVYSSLNIFFENINYDRSVLGDIIFCGYKYILLNMPVSYSAKDQI